MNMFVRFDEIPAMTLYNNKETKLTYAWTTLGGGGGGVYTKVVCTDSVHLSDQKKYMSHDMRFPKMWHFDMIGLRRACAASF